MVGERWRVRERLGVFGVAGLNGRVRSCATVGV